MKTKVSIQEAAKLLNVSKRTISSYIKEGLLTAKKEANSNKKYISIEDITQLKELREQNVSQFDLKKEIILLKAKCSKLESRLNVISRILDAKSEPLDLAPEDVQSIKHSCTVKLNCAFDFNSTQTWKEIFLRIDERDILKLCHETPYFWKELLKLNGLLIDQVISEDSYVTSLELQTLHRELIESRRRFRVSLVLYLELTSPFTSASTKNFIDSIGDKI